MMEPRVLRWEVPVDDQVHELPVQPREIKHVDCRHADAVEVWALEAGSAASRYLVTGTGQAAPNGAEYVGTALSPATDVRHLPDGGILGPMPRGRLVWHLWRLP